jgi:hypothetical protein
MVPIIDTAAVDFANLRGPAVQRGSGILYGLTETAPILRTTS